MRSDYVFDIRQYLCNTWSKYEHDLYRLLSEDTLYSNKIIDFPEEMANNMVFNPLPLAWEAAVEKGTEDVCVKRWFISLCQ